MSVASATTRVLNSQLESKIMSAAEAAALIRSGDQIGMSGFTGSGYPKMVPIELAHRIADAHFRGQKFQVSVFTGASTGPELDGALAMAGGIHLRLPYQSDPETRKRINAGEMDYMDIHLSHVAQFVEYGFLGKMDVALIEVTAILEDGRVVPSSSIGNNKTWIDCAERIISKGCTTFTTVWSRLRTAGRFHWCGRGIGSGRPISRFPLRRLPGSY
jgi:succinyl-CoA:acetate CoA-transferase